MIKYFIEEAETLFEGTIIDIEAIGKFDYYILDITDSRRCRHVKPVMMGHISGGHLQIAYIEDVRDLSLFLDYLKSKAFLDMPRPYYGFNCDFERSVLYHSCNLKIIFDFELNIEKFEGKARARKALKIPNYNDPFNDLGHLFPKAWLERRIEECLKHNRACLLKERDILSRRGCREPEELKLFP